MCFCQPKRGMGLLCTEKRGYLEGLPTPAWNAPRSVGTLTDAKFKSFLSGLLLFMKHISFRFLIPLAYPLVIKWLTAYVKGSGLFGRPA